MALFKNRKEKRYVEKALENSGAAAVDVADKRPIRGAAHAYKAGKDFDDAYKAAKRGNSQSPRGKNVRRPKK